MNQPKQQLVFKKSILALSVLMAVGSAYADDDEVAQLIKNESSISVGAAKASGASKDRSIFGQYNGLRNFNDIYPQVDISIINLQDTSGLWTRVEGRNLGQDNRELSFSQNKQGNWKYSLDYSEITHHDIRTLNTGLQGAGTATPTITSLAAPGTGANLNLQLQRQSVTLSGEKWITPNLMFETSFKNEDKSGARLTGVGIMCSNIGFPSRYPCGGTVSSSGAMLMLPEPVNTTTQQIDAKLNYSGEKFLVSGGYYGSFFTNGNGSINPTLSGNLYNPNGTAFSPALSTLTPGLATYLTAPIALAPDNQAQQLYVSGNYAFTQTTHANFKYSYTHATQNQNFSSMGLSAGPAGIGSLSGVADTNLVQFGLISRPIANLNVLANVRFEGKDDKTPLAAYNTTGTGASYSNDYSSTSRKLNGKLEAKYQFPHNYSATLGLDYASVERALPPSVTATEVTTDLGQSLGGLREKTHEVGYRAELRRNLSETLNGTIGYGHSERSGDSWTLYSTTGTLPMTMLDRKRDKLKLAADWMPTSKLTVQFNVESGADQYTGPILTGMRSSKMGAYGIDATLNVSEKWKWTGYVNQSTQTQHINHYASLAELDDISTSAGLGVGYKPSSKYDFGGNLSYINDTNRYLVGGLPDVTYRLVSLKLFGKYAVRKDSDVRVDVVHQNAKLDEWTWGSNGTPFTYSDNSTVSMQPNQSVNFVGASYILKFR